MTEPLSPEEAKRVIREILEGGSVIASRHAREEMLKDNLTMVDAENVLRAGVIDPAEWEGGSWRYRARTARMCFVVAFRSEEELRIVTAWREKR